jgi:hypothetical protein
MKAQKFKKAVAIVSKPPESYSLSDFIIHLVMNECDDVCVVDQIYNWVSDNYGKNNFRRSKWEELDNLQVGNFFCEKRDDMWYLYKVEEKKQWLTSTKEKKLVRIFYQQSTNVDYVSWAVKPGMKELCKEIKEFKL